MNRNRLLCPVVTAGLTAAYWALYNGWLSYVLFYHDRHRLFIYASDYIRRRSAIDGWTEVINDFVTQFCHIPWLGALILALLCALVYPLSQRLIRQLTGFPDIPMLSVAASVLVFLSTASIAHGPTLAWAVPAVLAVATILAGILLPARWLDKGLRRARNVRKLVWLSLLLAIAYLACGYVWLFRNINRSERTMLLTEQAMSRGDWDGVVRMADAYLNSGRQNKLMVMFRSIALARKGELAQRIMDIPQVYGIEGIFMPWRSDKRESEYGYYIYELAGHINEAHRWEFEAMTAWGPTAPHLVNLARFNIAMGRPQVADRFLRQLDKTLMYRGEARRLRGALEAGKVDGLVYRLAADTTQTNMFANVFNITSELMALNSADPADPTVRDLLLVSLLLSNRVEDFVDRLPHDLNPLPQLYQEALMVYKLKVGDEAFAAEGWTISPDVQSRFVSYAEASGHTDPMSLAARYGHTYWFYLNHMSPYGSKATRFADLQPTIPTDENTK